MKAGLDEDGFWRCPDMWHGVTVAVIGGGPSLSEHDWANTRSCFKRFGVRTIACNDGYRLGWPDAVFFGDWGWWEIHHRLRQFQRFAGLKIACDADCRGKPGVLALERRPVGWKVNCFQTEPKLIGWYGSTGISAINLAVKLGAKDVVLLGFDMGIRKGSPNWYNKLKDPDPNPGVYGRFIKWAKKLNEDMHELCPNVLVVNTTVDSSMDVFPKMELTKALEVLNGCAA